MNDRVTVSFSRPSGVEGRGPGLHHGAAGERRLRVHTAKACAEGVFAHGASRHTQDVNAACLAVRAASQEIGRARGRAGNSGARQTPCQTEHRLCRATLQTLPFAAARNLEVRYLGSSETPETAEPPWWDAATLNLK